MKKNKSDCGHFEYGRVINSGYHAEIDHLFQFLVPQQVKVLELGCGTGRLLASLKPSLGIGVDCDEEQIAAAQKINNDRSELKFVVGDVETISYSGYPCFDYIIISDLTGVLHDVQKTLSLLQAVCHEHTRIVVQFHSNLWRPILFFATLLGRRNKYPEYNWLSLIDMKNLLYLSGFDVITHGGRILLPLKIPVLNWFMNRFLAKIPFFNLGCLAWYVVARPSCPRKIISNQPLPSVSIVIPTRNEAGNIEAIFKRTPNMGEWTELIFVDGNSTDGTVEAIQKGMTTYNTIWKRIVLLRQTGVGKGQAVHQGFAECKGDVLMILDSDITMPPEELPKYYDALVSGKGEFINGCRLIYPMEKEAMRFLNMIANHIFAKIFTWLLGQPVKDTLCGTKVLWKSSYERIYQNRSYFGDFDPFGDFDLLFGASKQNLKIIDMPIRYAEREYGDIKIRRWKHGVLLLRMSCIAFWKFKIKT